MLVKYIFKITYFLYFFFLLSLSSISFAGPSFQQKTITDVGWEVTFTGSTYDANTNTTTFTYSVTASEWEKDLSHWTLAMDSDDVPTSTETNTSYGLDPTTGVYGFKWDNSQNSGTTQTYSITLHGNVGEVETEYAVKGGTYFAIGSTFGPGDGIAPPVASYSINGTAYIDANMDGAYTTDEPLLGNVTITLVDANGNIVTSVVTDENGFYNFSNIQNGEYTIVIQNTNDVDDFNESLLSYFTLLTESIAINVNDADVTQQDFGATLNVASVMDDINTSDPDNDGFSFAGTGKTIGYWKHQNRVAIKGKGRAHVSADTLLNYLNTIETLWLSEPFQFMAGNEYQDAFNIMSNTTSDANGLLRKQLLGTELNHVAGKGLSDAISLQGVILNWVEYLSANENLYTRETLLMAKDLCDAINNSGE